MPSKIFFKDGGAGLSSIKSTFVGDGSVDSASGDGGVADSEGSGNRDGSVSDAAAGDGIVAVTTGHGSAVGCMGVSCGLGMGADGSLRL